MRSSTSFTLLFVVITACGGATTTSLGSAGSNPDGTSNNDASAFSNSQNGSSGSSGSSGSGFDSSSDASASSIACGEGAGGDTCGKGEWCNRGPGVCAGKGLCETRPPPPPPSCPAAPDMYCGCNGVSYCSDEYGHNDGVEIAVHGSCSFACGDKTCDAITQYCDHGSGGPPPGVNIYECKPFAAAGCTEDRTCTCVQKSPGQKGELCDSPGGHTQVEHLYP